jgi:acyl-CoA dehydrogenase
MNHLSARQHLVDWQHSKPTNFFHADTFLQALLQHYLSDADYAEAYPNWVIFGEECATVIDEACRIEDKLGNHPKLERYNGIGERTESIEFHPNHDFVGRLVWQAGIMALQAQPNRIVEQMGLFFLLAHNGEAGHMCSLACTSGLIRALQTLGTDALKAQFLAPLLNTDYDQMQQGAQFLTEVQGGSDVGANSVQATLAPDGTWRINGEKWFCSNINANQFLMTARANNTEGTKGLGLFLVPRTLQDGTTNGFFIRRLKDKLGTRTLASAELDFKEAVAYALGEVEQGFKHVVELVLNTSRLMNAVACAGIMRRAYHEAHQYACHRQAFGQSLIHYPMVQEALADLHTEALANTASSFYIAHLVDKIDTDRATPQEKDVYRLLVNVNKYITSIRGSEMVHRAIEVLGGNGAIESFSVLPRLYRDMVVLESWEGTHNVLCVQVMRDIARYGIHEAYFSQMQAHLDSITAPSLAIWHSHAQSALSELQHMLNRIQSLDAHTQQAHARRFVDRVALTTQAILLLEQAQHQPRYTEACAYFINKHVRPNYDPLTDADYVPRLERLLKGLE